MKTEVTEDRGGCSSG